MPNFWVNMPRLNKKKVLLNNGQIFENYIIKFQI
jgi:hypothetical protein